VTTPSDTVAQAAGANDSTTTPATSDDTAQPAASGNMPKPSATHAMNTGTMVVHPPSPAAKAKPAAKKSSLASSAKPSHSVVVEPENRDVVLLGYPKPAYPREALREHEQGTVLVLAQVDVQGHVSDARVIRHSGSFALDRAATNEVRSWQFRPALHDGKPAIASVQVPVSYRLDQ
jgi:protein TonB